MQVRNNLIVIFAGIPALRPTGESRLVDHAEAQLREEVRPQVYETPPTPSPRPRTTRIPPRIRGLD
jgi:hypothetical protein